MRPELADETGLIDHLPDEVRGVIVHAHVAVPGFEDAPPDVRRVGDVMPPRPLVVAEDHRTVLEGQLDAVLAGKRDDFRPDLLRLLPVRVDVLRSVAAAKSIDLK